MLEGMRGLSSCLSKKTLAEKWRNEVEAKEIKDNGSEKQWFEG